MQLAVARWTAAVKPEELTLRQQMHDEGLRPYAWSNGPFDRYAAHSHEYHKVIYVVSGSITFGLPETAQQFVLGPADRLNLPSGTVHEASAGSPGVTCLEAHRG